MNGGNLGHTFIDNKWISSKDNLKITGWIEGIKFFWSADSGNKETSGSGCLLARHFFKHRWQTHFQEVFTKSDLDEINQNLKVAYRHYLSERK